MPSKLELFKSLRSAIFISFFTSALFTQLAVGKPIVVKRQGPAVVVEEAIVDGWLAITSTDIAPVGVEAAAFSGAVIQDMFGNLDQDKPWEVGSGNCVMSISTWGGGHCSVDTTPGPKANAGSQTTHHDDGKDWNVCWYDDKLKESGIQYFTDPGIGKYSIEFTAHDGTIGVDGTEKCLVQGICNPIVKFYRPNYYLTEYMYNGTWNGDWTGDGEYPQCSGGVTNQFHKGGAVMGWTCSVPCYAETKLPTK